MDLNSLAIFAKVAELTSFSDAARALAIPTSTVSRKIAELEADLGVRLIERSTRSLRLTEVGSEILRHAQQSAELAETVDKIVSNRASDVSGMLRVSAPPSLSDSLIAPLVGGFQASYPDVHVQIVITDHPEGSLSEGVDVALRIGSGTDTNLVTRRLLTYRHRLVASPAYVQASGAPKSPDDLLHHSLVAFCLAKPLASWTFVHGRGRKQTITFEPYLSMNDYAGLVPALLAGRGIGDLPEMVQSKMRSAGELVEVMLGWSFPSTDLSIVHAAHRYVPRRVRVFNEFAVEMASTLFPNLAPEP